MEKILAQRGHGRKVEYLVQRKGYPPSENQWRPATDLKGAPEELQEYRERQKEVPGRKR